MAKLLTVFGATGQQGGAVIRYVLETPSLSSVFTLRGVTRDASKPASNALKEMGVEMVEADLDVESTLAKAVAGSHTVFGVTNFWEKASADVEVAQGKAIADAAVAAGATQLIWSSLPSIAEMTAGKMIGPKHFESKAEVEKYIRTLNIKSMFFMTAWFMQNQLGFMRPREADDGTYVFAHPWDRDTPLPLIDIRDAGKFVAPALLNPNLYHGKRFTCATAFYTPGEMADTWTKVTSTSVKAHTVGSGKEMSMLSEEQQKETKNARKLIIEFGYFGPGGKEDLAWTLKQLKERPRTWEEFVHDYEPWFQQSM